MPRLTGSFCCPRTLETGRAWAVCAVHRRAVANGLSGFVPGISIGRAVKWRVRESSFMLVRGYCPMVSPFPGMDPYIEVSHLWEDFHTNLIGEIYRALSDVLPDRYVVRAGERSYVALACADDDEDQRSFLPDVTVATSRGSSKSRRKSKELAGATARQLEPGPLMMEALVKAEYRETFLE